MKTVGILSTARKISEEEVAPSVSWLERCGYRVILGKTIGASCGQFAGDDPLRASDLQHMISSKDIDVIWCARGGYGTARIIDDIDFSPLAKNPKWIVGYSDVTALHNALNVLGIKSVHGTMPVNVSTCTNEALESLTDIWQGKSICYRWKNVFSSYDNQEITAEIVGGNLSVIYSLLGSESSIATEGKILFLEDLDEYLYHVDRMMLNLKRNGYLSKLRGVVVGAMTCMHDNPIAFGRSVHQIILSHTKEFGYPVIFGFPAGHIPDNRAFVLGKESLLRIKGDDIIFEQIF